jgi:hypothetical protein
MFNGVHPTMAKTATLDRPKAPGLVSADCLYTLAEVQERLKLGQAAMRQARRAGLRVRKIGRRRYVLGRDLLAYVDDASN